MVGIADIAETAKFSPVWAGRRRTGRLGARRLGSCRSTNRNAILKPIPPPSWSSPSPLRPRRLAGRWEPLSNAETVPEVNGLADRRLGIGHRRNRGRSLILLGRAHRQLSLRVRARVGTGRLCLRLACLDSEPLPLFAIIGSDARCTSFQQLRFVLGECLRWGGGFRKSQRWALRNGS